MGRHNQKPHQLYLVQRESAAPRRESAAPRNDVQVRQAIELMLAELAERWTVTRLARRVALSRPAFARRFVASTSMSPLRYLARARMMRAAELLRETDLSLAQIGARVGYDSEFAFNRAFKRIHHVAPGTFRRLSFVTTPVLRAVA